VNRIYQVDEVHQRNEIIYDFRNYFNDSVIASLRDVNSNRNSNIDPNSGLVDYSDNIFTWNFWVVEYWHFECTSVINTGLQGQSHHQDVSGNKHIVLYYFYFNFCSKILLWATKIEFLRYTSHYPHLVIKLHCKEIKSLPTRITESLKQKSLDQFQFKKEDFYNLVEILCDLNI
jgi:hypothetical protein